MLLLGYLTSFALALGLHGIHEQLGMVPQVLVLPLAWIGLAVSVKRWHDRGKSGWWMLIAFVPVIGPIWQWVETGFLRGTNGPNRYGPEPL